jgi:uncharacterized membrane protein (UPF0136 family)
MKRAHAIGRSMIELARVYLLVFGTLTIGAGLVGYVRAKSRPSLIAGGVSGILLLLAGYLIGSSSVTGGLLLGLVQSAALAARFVPSFTKTRAFFPAGLMALLSVGGIGLTLVGFVSK